MVLGRLIPDESLAVGAGLRHLVYFPFPHVSAEIAFARVPVLIPSVRSALGAPIGIHG